MDYFKSLPAEVTLEILARVSTDLTPNCKFVCKNWNNLVSNHPSFSKLHLRHLSSNSGKLAFFVSTEYCKWYYYEYNENQDQLIQRIRKVTIPDSSWIVGCCDGLICLVELNQTVVSILNPFTKESVVLPQIKKHSGIWSFGFGFCFVSSTNEYKVVRLGYPSSTKSIEVLIYTIGSGNGWRNIGNFDFDLGNLPWFTTIFVDGAIYWPNRLLKKITTFDLAEEKFCKHLSPPPLPSANDWNSDEIGFLDGSLFFYDDFGGYHQGEDEGRYIWLLKRKNDDHNLEQQQEAWSKEFRILSFQLVAITKTNGVLTHNGHYLYIEDPKASTSKSLVNFKKDAILRVYPHMNTLVSLKQLGEEDTEVMELIKIEEIEVSSKEYHDPPSIIGG